MEYLAHIAEDGRKQTVTEHLHNTAIISAAFAKEFGLEEHGYLVGQAHDIGKCSEGFQNRLHGGAKVDHATAGAIECAKIDCLQDACAVIGHHGGLPDFGNINTDQPGDSTFCGRMKKGISGGIEPYHCTESLKKPSQTPPQDMLQASFWTRMLYSCLVDADYLDTEAFMSASTVERGQGDSLSVLLQKLQHYVEPWFPAQNSINAMRCKILQTCLGKGVLSNGIYTLTVPTGGGKTIASLGFALRHAVAHKMKRIIYVIPYTSIIEQNAQVFKEILGDENVIEHHSGLVYDANQETSSKEAIKCRAIENWDAPVIVTTAVQFFESIYANKSSKCRKLHNIANSVIIFDEAQMIPMCHLRPCVAAIGNCVAQFGCSAVLCTATQPVLSDLIQEYAAGIPIQELSPDIETVFTQFRRVTFENLGQQTTHTLAERLSEKDQILCIVNTRKEAQEIYHMLTGDGNFHLSTLMYPAHRQAILKEIRHRLISGKPCRVISTSLIEAGVDVDFPFVYREIAGLDSILQAAGRCNREGKRKPEDSVVSIFEGEIPAPPLFRINIGACREALQGNKDPGDPETVTRYFSSLRSLAGNDLDKAGIISAMSKGLAGCMLPFATVAERFRLINEATKTVYIPVGNGAHLIEKIRSGRADRSTYRALGRYGVSVYEKQYDILQAKGLLEILDDESAVLKDINYYHESTGLKNDF